MNDPEEKDLLDPIYRIDEGISTEVWSFWFKTAFWVLFLIGGSVMLYDWLARPWMETRAAESWVTVPCRVVSIEVKTRYDDETPSDYVAIEFSYRFKGREYRGDRYSLSPAYDQRGLKSRIPAQYPVGEVVDCFVNPENPAESTVLREHFFLFHHVGGPLLFMLLGLWGIQRERKLLTSAADEE